MIILVVHHQYNWASSSKTNLCELRMLYCVPRKAKPISRGLICQLLPCEQLKDLEVGLKGTVATWGATHRLGEMYASHKATAHIRIIRNKCTAAGWQGRKRQL